MINGEVSQACRDQIEKAITECLTPPTQTEAERDGYAGVTLGPLIDNKPNINSNAKAAVAAYKYGEYKFAKHAELCATNEDEILSACEAMIQDLRTADSNNRKDQALRQAEIDSSGAPPAEVSNATIENSREHNMVSEKLMQQVDANSQARDMALKNVRAQKVCSIGQAQIYAQAAIGGQRTVAASTGGAATDMGDAESQLAGAPIENLSEQVSEEAGWLESTKEAALEAGEKFVTDPNRIPEVIVDMSSAGIKKVVPTVAGAAVATVSAPAAVLIGMTRPVGSCSDINYDPVQAYIKSCPVTPMMQNSAINTLNQN